MKRNNSLDWFQRSWAVSRRKKMGLLAEMANMFFFLFDEYGTKYRALWCFAIRWGGNPSLGMNG